MTGEIGQGFHKDKDCMKTLAMKSLRRSGVGRKYPQQPDVINEQSLLNIALTIELNL